MQIQTISSIVLFVLLLAMLYLVVSNKSLLQKLRSSEKVPSLFYWLFFGLISCLIVLFAAAWISIATGYSNM